MINATQIMKDIRTALQQLPPEQFTLDRIISGYTPNMTLDNLNLNCGSTACAIGAYALSEPGKKLGLYFRQTSYLAINHDNPISDRGGDGFDTVLDYLENNGYPATALFGACEDSADYYECCPSSVTAKQVIDAITNELERHNEYTN